MKLGIKYCGGCNPHIDRKLLVQRVRESLKTGTYAFEYFDFKDCEVMIVVNGCNVGCAEIPRGKNDPVIVSGLKVDGKQYLEENLPAEVVGRLLITDSGL